MLVPLQPDQSGASGYHTTAPTSSHVQGHSHVQGAGCYLDDEFDTDLAKAISVSLKGTCVCTCMCDAHNELNWY